MLKVSTKDQIDFFAILFVIKSQENSTKTESIVFIFPEIFEKRQ